MPASTIATRSTETSCSPTSKACNPTSESPSPDGGRRALASAGQHMRATAQQVGDPNAIAHDAAVFSLESVAQDLGELTIDDVTGHADLRLFHARVDEHWILENDRDVRVRVHLGTAPTHRVASTVHSTGQMARRS
jgi:hypothetical protein